MMFRWESSHHKRGRYGPRPCWALNEKLTAETARDFQSTGTKGVGIVGKVSIKGRDTCGRLPVVLGRKNTLHKKRREWESPRIFLGKVMLVLVGGLHGYFWV